MINKGIWDDGLIWKPSNFGCECDKSCDVGEYLDYEDVNVEKNWLINYLKNVGEILTELKWFMMGLWMIMGKCAILVQYT